MEPASISFAGIISGNPKRTFVFAIVIPAAPSYMNDRRGVWSHEMEVMFGSVQMGGEMVTGYVGKRRNGGFIWISSPVSGVSGRTICKAFFKEINQTS